MMLLKIYLGISVLTLIMFSLTNLSNVKRLKRKYGDNLFEDEKDTIGTIMVYLKTFIASFIPIYNIFILITLVFCGEKIYKQLEENAEKEIENNK